MASRGGPPAPPGTDLQYTLVSQGRLSEPAQFERLIVRTGADGQVEWLYESDRINAWLQERFAG